MDLDTSGTGIRNSQKQRIAEMGVERENERYLAHEYKGFGNKSPESMKKDDTDEEMVLKKRRNLREIGCVRDLYQGCCDWKSAKGEIGEKTTGKAEKVALVVR